MSARVTRVTHGLRLGKTHKIFFSFAFDPTRALISDHEEVGRMEDAERFAAFGMIVEFDCRRLIVIFANRRVVLEFQNGRQLIAVRFELNGAAHFAAGVTA
jgi:hypothetical protein